MLIKHLRDITFGAATYSSDLLYGLSIFIELFLKHSEWVTQKNMGNQLDCNLTKKILIIFRVQDMS